MKRLLIFMFMFVAMMFSGYSVLDDANLYYSFDEDDTTGTIMIDISGNGNNGTCTMDSGCDTVQGLLINASDFDGVNDYIYSDSSITFGTTFSVSLWVNISSVSYIISTREFAPTNWWTIQTSGSNTILAQLNNGAVQLDSGVTSNSSYQHVILTLDGTTARIFVDGVLRNSVAMTTSYSNERVSIGKFSTLYTTAFIDEVGIWNRNLTESEISDLYNSGAGYNPYTPTAPAFTITTNTQTYYTSENISIDVNTSALTNISYYLNNDDLINSDSLIAYYQAEDNANDRLGTYNGTEFNGVSYTDSKNQSYWNAFNFDGVDDYIEVGDVYDTSSSWSMSYWLYKPSTSLVTAFMYKSRGTGNALLLNLNTDDTLNFKTWNSVNIASDLTTTTTLSNGWNYLTFTYDSSTQNKSIYINGVYDKSQTVSDVAEYSNTDVIGGDPANYLNGSMDEIRIYQKVLSQSEITNLYSSTPYVSHCSDCNTTTINLYNLDEGLNDLNLITESLLQTESFTIDTIAPNISIIGNITQDFEVNFSTVFNVTDALSGLASCTINATYLENITNASQYDRDGDCTDTIVFGATGLYNGFLTAIDNAGNIETLSINGTVETFVYLNFFNENATAINNYSAIIYHPDGEIEYIYNTSNPIELSPYHDDKLDIGTYIVTFDKLGYDLYNISVVINETSGGEVYNYSVPGALIQITVYDINDFTLIDNSTTTIEIIGSSFSQSYTTSTGYLNITSLFMEEETYNVIVSNSDYETSTIAFNFNNQEIITVDAYLTPLEVNETLIADLIIRVIDDYETPLKGINVIQYVWDSGQSKYVQANLKATDYAGETSFKVFLNTKLYNFCAEYQGVQYCETDLSININTEEVVIEVPISEIAITDIDPIYDVEFSYTLTNTSYESGGVNYTSVTFSYSNPSQDVDEYCLKIYEINNLQRTLVANQCDSSHITGLSIDIIENTSKSYVAIATVQVGDSIRQIDSLTLYAQYELQEELEQFGFVKLVLLVIISFVIGVALYKKVHNILIAHLGLPIVYLIFSIGFPAYITFESFVLVLLVNYFAYQIVTQKDDLQREAKFTTLNSILALYMIFIFGLFTALTEIDDKGLLDDYGQTILSNIDDQNSYFDNYIDSSKSNLLDERADAKGGAWELLTGIFLKTLEFLDTFFSVLSNLFNIGTNMALIIGIENALLLKFLKLLDYVIVAYVVYLYFKEAFK